jgi:hypothetical protein
MAGHFAKKVSQKLKNLKTQHLTTPQSTLSSLYTSEVPLSPFFHPIMK